MPDSDAAFPIVALGASAGGVSVLRTIVAALPPDPGVAVVAILHLSSEGTSHLPRILDRAGGMTVRTITDGMRLERDVVHVLPPGQSVRLEGETLRLEARQGGIRWRPIDTFFESLAAAGARAVAVVLSGTGTNGSALLGGIRSAGGLVLVQSPDEAEFKEMPRHAIATGQVDLSAGCVQLVDAITGYRRALPVVDSEPPDDGALVERAIGLVRERHGRDFSGYKRNTIHRRLLRRASLRRSADLAAYLDLVQEDPEELGRLSEDLLIGVTGFFRDRVVWDVLADSVLPDLLNRDADAERPFRVWVAGCASGEEAYTLAILLNELMEQRGIERPLQIFATDLDDRACERARRGRFPSEALAGMSSERRALNFTYDDGSWRAKPAIRDAITFAVHNLLRDPPFSQVDLVTCRNVLIYLDAEAQEQVLGLFHFALRHQGVLVLGSSETAQRQEELFEPLDESNRCYRRRFVASPTPAFASWREVAPPRHRLPPPPGPVQRRRLADEHRMLARDLALRHFAPAFVLVDDRLQVTYYSGPTSRFLHQPEGAPSDDLLAICAPGSTPRCASPRRMTAS